MENSTTPLPIIIFNNSQKSVLPLVFMPCAIICFVLYKYAKKRLVNENLGKRLQYFYSIISTALFGHVLFRAMPIMKQPYPIFVALGYFVMICVQKLSRTWRMNDSTISTKEDYSLIRNHKHCSYTYRSDPPIEMVDQFFI